MRSAIAALIVAGALIIGSAATVAGRQRDACPNLAGLQKTVPYGFQLFFFDDGSWECHPIGTTPLPS